MFAPLQTMLKSIFKSGNLTVKDARGNDFAFGDGKGEPVQVHIKDKYTERALFFDASLALGEAYMDKRLTIEQGTIYEFVDLVLNNISSNHIPGLSRYAIKLRKFRRALDQLNNLTLSRKNVTHHYDIDDRIYDLMLDENRQYSCGYFKPGQDNLDIAQRDKMDHICKKLNLKDGQKILDIGSGWGGLALYLAQQAKLDILGITLSENQMNYAQKWAQRKDLHHRVHFELKDYRKLNHLFDRIVSVGMFEHVGIRHFKSYFNQIYRLLAEDGVAMIHTIGRTDGPGATGAFTRKYIFPGGYTPALSEILPAIEQSGLMVADIEIWHTHYAETLKNWRHRFMERRNEAVQIMDDRFCLMWEMYLAGAEAAFRHDNLNVFQLQLVKNRAAIPRVRDYLYQ